MTWNMVTFERWAFNYFELKISTTIEKDEKRKKTVSLSFFLFFCRKSIDGRLIFYSAMIVIVLQIDVYYRRPWMKMFVIGVRFLFVFFPFSSLSFVFRYFVFFAFEAILFVSFLCFFFSAFLYVKTLTDKLTEITVATIKSNTGPFCIFPTILWATNLFFLFRTR